MSDPRSKFENSPFEIHIPSSGQTLNIASYESLSAWAEEQRQLWQPAAAVARVQPVATDHAWRQVDEFLSHLRDLAHKVSTETNIPERSKKKVEIAEYLEMFENGNRPTADSPVGESILELVDRNPTRAAARLVWAVSGRITDQHQNFSPVFLKELIDVHVEDQIGHNEPKRHKARLSRLKSDWNANFSKLEGQARGRLAQGIRLGAAALRRLNTAKRANQETMERVERTFIEQMRLRAPGTYWRNRAARHSIVAAVAFGAFALVGGGSVGLLAWNWDAITSLALAPTGDFSLLPTVVAVFPALIVLWLLRLISRIFVASLSTVRDAAQRSVMVQTYLALMAERDAAMRSEDRLLILQALFRPERPSADDDAPPPNLLEIMEKAAGTKKT